jgi:hypothetical protein
MVFGVVGGSLGMVKFWAANAHEMSAPAGERTGAGAGAGAGAGVCCATSSIANTPIRNRAETVVFTFNLLVQDGPDDCHPDYAIDVSAGYAI